MNAQSNTPSIPREAPPRRYFDNAATTFPKPPGVADAVRDYLLNVGASAGRGAYREAVDSGRLLERCRGQLRAMFACRPDDHVVFTLNGTDALHLALEGLLQPGDHAVTTRMDHNSVLRPLAALETRIGLTWTAVPADPQDTLVSTDDFRAALRPDTRLAVVNHASNVTGALQPLDDFADVCRERGVTLLVDAAQTAGHVPIDLSRTPFDLLATPGHKGLLGPLGTGVLLIRAGVERRMRPVRAGGTGSRSESARQPEDMPDKFESGSHNAVGIAGLSAALDWLAVSGVAGHRAHERELIGRMIDGLSTIDGLLWFGPRDADRRVGVFSVRADGVAPEDLSALLESQSGLLTRSGLHCAPLAHETIRTASDGGTTRLSLGPFLADADVDAAIDALRAAVSAARELV